MDHEGLRTWIEIDTSRIEHNYNIFRSKIKSQRKLCGVVKSNAYGHDFMQYAKKLQKLGIDYLAVDSIFEGVRLRKEGIKMPILILGYTLPEKMQEAVDNNLDITISTFESLESVSGIKDAKLHIKLDTGMSRQGFLGNDVSGVIKIIKERKLKVEGVFTHFASAKNPTLSGDTKRQIERFKVSIELFKKSGVKALFHAGATSGALIHPEAHFDMVRIGIGLYGLWPSNEVREFLSEKIELKPVMSWKTVIGEVKKVPAGEKVGYGGTEILDRDSILAICPIGYWHGYSRRLSGIAKVYVNGQKARVIGLVSMDMITIDVTDCDVKVGDGVELLGKDISVYDMAMWDDTTWYETVTRINPLIKRIYL